MLILRWNAISICTRSLMTMFHSSRQIRRKSPGSWVNLSITESNSRLRVVVWCYLSNVKAKILSSYLLQIQVLGSQPAGWRIFLNPSINWMVPAHESMVALDSDFPWYAKLWKHTAPCLKYNPQKDVVRLLSSHCWQ